MAWFFSSLCSRKGDYEDERQAFIVGDVDEHNDLRKRVDYLEATNKDLQSQLKQVCEERDDFRNRLSGILSNRLKDGNPDICDLSDPSRATKLAEISRELYDNEWTDAFEYLTKQLHMVDDEAIRTLLDILRITYLICESRAKTDETWRRVTEFIGDDDDANAQSLRQQLKEYRRKSRWESMVPGMVQNVRSKVVSGTCQTQLQQTYISDQGPVSIYMKLCVQLCLHMVLQDPAVVWHCPGWKLRQLLSINDGEENVDLIDLDENREIFDSNMFKDYTQSGKYVKFYVWPAMLLYDGGSLLHRGVAQGC